MAFNRSPINQRRAHSSSQVVRTKIDSRLFALQLPSTPLVAATDTWGNWATLTGTAAISQLAGKTTKIGRLLGPPVTAMAITFLLASIGVLAPGGTPAAKSMQLLSLQLATPLLLLGADLRDCASRCGPLLYAFLLASLATAAACIVAWRVSGKMLQTAMGVDGLIIAAALMAKNIGGGINYVAVCRSLNASPAAVAAGLCVDNLFALIYFPITSALASGRPDVITSNDCGATDENDDLMLENQPISVQQASMALSLAAVLTWIGEKIGGTVAALPITTLVSVLVASRAPSSFMKSVQPASHMIGTVCLYLFFATAGAPGLAVADSVKAALVPLGLFLTLLYGVHGIILSASHCLWGQKSPAGPFVPQRLLVASSAAIGGPATAVALAQANGWKSLIAPSLLVGNLGYAIATFCGIAYHAFFSTHV
jgi:uncharacterized membrane protein